VCAQQWTKIEKNEKKTRKKQKNKKKIQKEHTISDYYQGRFKIKTGSELKTLTEQSQRVGCSWTEILKDKIVEI